MSAPVITLDADTTPFTVGGSCDMNATVPICGNSFCGYIDDVRVWTVARSQSEILNYIYSEPAVDCPTLALSVTFDQVTSSVGHSIAVTYLDNCTVKYVNRNISVAASNLIRPLTKAKVAHVEAAGSHESSIHVQGEIFEATTEDDVTDIVTMESTTDDENPVEIWIRFTKRMLSIIIRVLGLDVDDDDVLDAFARKIWAIDSIRSIITAFGNRSTDLLPVIMANREYIDELHEKWSNTSPGDLLPIIIANREYIDKLREQGSNTPLGDLPDGFSPEGLAEDILGFFMAIIFGGLFLAFIKCVRLGMWSFLKIVSRFGGPWAAAVFITLLGFVYLVEASTAVDDLNHELDINRATRSRPGINLQFDSAPIENKFQIPLRLGGAGQTIKVSLIPPAMDNDTEVAISSLQMGVAVSPSTLTFPVGSTDRQDVVVTATGIPADAYAVVFKLPNSTQGIKAAFDVREQAVKIDSEELAISVDQPVATMKVYLDAIVDPDQTVVVNITDLTPDINPEPGKVFGLTPSQLTFRRTSNRRHRGTVQTVAATFSPLPLVPPTSNKRKDIEAAGVGVAKKSRTKVITKDTTHTTLITMIRAGKGDSYIVSDREGGATDLWSRMLIDGGAGGTWPRIQYAMNSLGMIGLLRAFDAVVVTHYDDDHINGILRMLRTGPAPIIHLCTFNAPPPPATAEDFAEMMKADRKFSTPDEDDDSSPQLPDEPPPFYSPAQGRLLSTVLAQLQINTVAPAGNPPAVPDPATNTLAVFPTLVTAIRGPTIGNVNAMHANPYGPEIINRSSTILTMTSAIATASGSANADGLSFLFSGDAHDTLPSHCDIRGNPTPMVPAGSAHFSVMKV
jgi:hypothetical protein